MWNSLHQRTVSEAALDETDLNDLKLLPSTLHGKIARIKLIHAIIHNYEIFRNLQRDMRNSGFRTNEGLSVWMNDIAVLEVYGRIVLNSSTESKLDLPIHQKDNQHCGQNKNYFSYFNGSSWRDGSDYSHSYEEIAILSKARELYSMFWSVREEPPDTNCIRLFQRSLGGQVNLRAPVKNEETVCSSSLQGMTSWLLNELDSMTSGMSFLMKKKNTTRDKTNSKETNLALKSEVDRILFDAQLANLSTCSNRRQLLEDFPKI